jgi:hypothetical protein
MLKTDDIAQFVAISGLLNYCKSHDDCKRCDMYSLCNVLTGEKKLTYVIDKIKFERDEFIESILSTDEGEEDDD